MSAKDTPRKGTTVNKKYQKNAPKTSTGPGLAVPDAVTIAMSEIAEDMREGLLALAVGAGLQVLGSLMEADVAAVCGPRGRHDPPLPVALIRSSTVGPSPGAGRGICLVPCQGFSNPGVTGKPGSLRTRNPRGTFTLYSGRAAKVSSTPVPSPAGPNRRWTCACMVISTELPSGRGAIYTAGLLVDTSVHLSGSRSRYGVGVSGSTPARRLNQPRASSRFSARLTVG